MGDICIKRWVYFVQKRFLATTSTSKMRASTVSPTSFTVQFLTSTCGLPLDSALLASQKLQLEEKKSKKYLAVLSFLSSHGFSETHIANVIGKHPAILHNQVDKTIKPKIEFFLKKGISDSVVADLIVANPSILKRSLSSHLQSSYDFLKSFLKTEEETIAALKRAPWLLTDNLKNTMRPNVDLLIMEGVPLSNIVKLIIRQPRAITQTADKMVAAIESIKTLGLKPSSPIFIRALRVVVSLSDDTWKRKCNVLKSFGLSEEQITLTFTRDPFYMFCSEDKIKRAMNFFINTVQVKPAVIVSYPILLMLGLETRIHPRYNVMKALESKKLIRHEKVVWALISERLFLKDYVTKYLDQIPGLMEIYKSPVSESSNQVFEHFAVNEGQN